MCAGLTCVPQISEGRKTHSGTSWNIPFAQTAPGLGVSRVSAAFLACRQPHGSARGHMQCAIARTRLPRPQIAPAAAFGGAAKCCAKPEFAIEHSGVMQIRTLDSLHPESRIVIEISTSRLHLDFEHRPRLVRGMVRERPHDDLAARERAMS